MNLKTYFENTRGTGIISTADSNGRVNAAVYARPHVIVRLWFGGCRFFTFTIDESTFNDIDKDALVWLIHFRLLYDKTMIFLLTYLGIIELKLL